MNESVCHSIIGKAQVQFWRSIECIDLLKKVVNVPCSAHCSAGFVMSQGKSERGTSTLQVPECKDKTVRKYFPGTT